MPPMRLILDVNVDSFDKIIAQKSLSNQVKTSLLKQQLSGVARD